MEHRLLPYKTHLSYPQLTLSTFCTTILITCFCLCQKHFYICFVFRISYKHTGVSAIHQPSSHTNQSTAPEGKCSTNVTRHITVLVLQLLCEGNTIHFDVLCIVENINNDNMDLDWDQSIQKELSCHCSVFQHVVITQQSGIVYTQGLCDWNEILSPILKLCMPQVGLLIAVHKKKHCYIYTATWKV